jgi:predicted RNA-binding protein with PIN domain
MHRDRDMDREVHQDRDRLIVVDAANVVGSRPDGWWRDRAGAARRLLLKLAGLEERLAEPIEVVVVLEGAAREAVVDTARPGDVQVVLAKGSGDDAIVDVVRAAAAEDSGRSITVVTADRGLRERVESLGASTVGPRWIWDHLDE